MRLCWVASAAMIVATSLGGVSALANRVAGVRQTPAGAALYVDQQPTSPTIFLMNHWEPGYLAVQQGEIETAGRYGVNIVSFNLTSGMPWSQYGEIPNWAGVDYHIDKVLEANPNALLIPRFDANAVPQWWKDAHPEQMMLYDQGAGTDPWRASIHSQLWRQDSANSVRAMIAHFEQKYGDHMLGYTPCGQTTGEWFFQDFWTGKLSGYETPAVDAFRAYLRTRYGTDQALRTAWSNQTVTLYTAQTPTVSQRTGATYGQFHDPATEQNVIDFADFENNEMADVASYICQVVKDVAPNKLALVYFGYHFELYGDPWAGHLGLGRLLQSPYVDMVASPFGYGDRAPGGTGNLHSPVDSIVLNGKMGIEEDDTQTYLDPPEDPYWPPANKIPTARLTYGVLARNSATIIARGAGTWWTDLFGMGWLAGDEMWQHISSWVNDYRSVMPNLKQYTPEIAVIVDEKSCLYAGRIPTPGQGWLFQLNYDFRRQYHRIGAPIGSYLLDDLVNGKVPPARMYIFLDLFRLDDAQLQAIRTQACRPGCVVVWMYAPGIVHGNAIDPNNVSQVTGIDLSQITTGDGTMIVQGTGQWFSAGHGHLTPTFAVNDGTAAVLARYNWGNGVAVASKAIDGYTSVYCGALQLPTNLLRALAQQAGVWIYNDAGETVAAGNGFVSLHAQSTGSKVLRMPRECWLQDPSTGEVFGKASTFTFSMELGDTKLLRLIGPAVVSSLATGAGMWSGSALADGSTSTVWTSASHAGSDAVEWASLYLGGKVSVESLRVTPAAGGAGFPVDFRLQYSNDGATWVDIGGQSYTSYPNPGGAAQVFAFGWPVEASYFRLLATRLSTIGAGSYALSLAEMAAIPNAGPQWEFNIEGNTESWQVQHSVSGLAASGGSLTGNISGADPIIGGPSSPSIDASVRRYIHIRMKIDSGSHAQFFWKTPSLGYYSEDRSVALVITPDGQFHDYCIDMSANPAWTGTVNALRLDPTEAGSGHFEIDFIRVVPAAQSLTPPAGSVTINSGAAYTGSTSVVLALSAADTSGVGITQMRLGSDGSTWNAWEPYSTSKAWTLTGGNTAYAQFMDGAGGVSPSCSDSIALDTTAPAGSALINSGATFTKSPDVSVSVPATDAGSGVSRMRLSTDGVSWSAFEPYATPRTLTLAPGDGLRRAYVQFQDSVGNISATCNDSIIVDTTLPVLPGTPTDAGAYTGGTSLVFNWTASSDPNGSGIQGYDCQIGTTPGGSDIYSGYVGNMLSKTVTGSLGKTCYCHVQARDRAGNLSGWTASSDGIAIVAHPGVGIDQAKAFADSESVGLPSKLVTAVFGSCFYVGEQNRTAGIKVVPPTGMPEGLSIGDVVSVGGVVKTGPDGERYVEGVVSR